MGHLTLDQGGYTSGLALTFEQLTALCCGLFFIAFNGVLFYVNHFLLHFLLHFGAKYCFFRLLVAKVSKTKTTVWPLFLGVLAVFGGFREKWR